MGAVVDVIGACGSIATVGGLGLAYLDLRKNRLWRRAEFVANLIKDWEADPGVRAVQKILDYRGKKMRMADYGGRTESEERVSSQLVAESLQLPSQRRVSGRVGTASFADIEHDLRDAFDRFLDGIDRFQTYVEARLVSVKEFGPYLGYWVSKLGADSVHDASTLSVIEAYARQFHRPALTLLQGLGATFVVKSVGVMAEEEVDQAG